MTNHISIAIDLGNENALKQVRDAIRRLRTVEADILQGTNHSQGTCWDRHNQKWKARISRGGKLLHLGYFRTQDEAIAAVQNAKIGI